MFREFGPLSGSTMRLGYEVAPPSGSLLGASDVRCRRALLPATRRHRACWRCAPAASRAGARRRTSSTSAATPRCAATTTSSSSARTSSFANAELRFPLIEAMLTPLGVLGGIRGVFFANMGGGYFRARHDYKFCTSNSRDRTRRSSATRTRSPVIPRSSHGQPIEISGLPAAGRPRLLRRRPRDLRARLPNPLRLGVEDAVQQGLGRCPVLRATAAAKSSARRSSRCGLGTTSRG